MVRVRSQYVDSLLGDKYHLSLDAGANSCMPVRRVGKRSKPERKESYKIYDESYEKYAHSLRSW